MIVKSDSNAVTCSTALLTLGKMNTGVGNPVGVLVTTVDTEDDDSVGDSEAETKIEDVVSMAAQQKCDVTVMFHK